MTHRQPDKAILKVIKMNFRSDLNSQILFESFCNPMSYPSFVGICVTFATLES